MKKKWIIKPDFKSLKNTELDDYENLVQKLLMQRGITTKKQAFRFLHSSFSDLHDPFLFTNMKDAIAMIKEARDKQEIIAVYGDYDADGVPGSAILSLLFKKMNIAHTVYLPHREKEGYGLQIKAIDYLHKKGCSVIITCDCGISNIQEVAHARSLGINVIITDHHSAKSELPNAIILHPSIDGETYPYKYLAGGGVTFKLMQALILDYIKGLDQDEKKEWLAFEKWILDLPAISTVADMVPLTGENRIISKFGLLVLNKTRNLGLKSIIEKASVRMPITTSTIGFQIAPRINSAGRMDHANVAYQLLVSETEEEATQLAEELERNNNKRRKVTEHIFEEAKEMLGGVEKQTKKILSVIGHDWSNGLLGLVAGRLVNLYNLPVIVMSKSSGEITGSVRSIPQFNFINALREIEKFFSKYGGHPMAAGFTLADSDDYDDFLKSIEKIINRELKNKDLDSILEIDSELDFSEISEELVGQIKLFEPFGVGNKEPLFLTKNANVVDYRKVGTDGSHLKISFSDNDGHPFDGIGFKFGSFADELNENSKVDVVYSLGINEWKGNSKIQLMIKDIQISN